MVLNDDLSRCYGKDCEQRDDCMRYLTIGRDEPHDRFGRAIIKSYAISMKHGDSCDMKIKGD